MKISSFPEVMIELGNASYSIYLIHPIVFSYVYAYLQPPLPPLWMQEPLRYGALAAVCLISLVTWQIIERPMIAAGDFLALRFDGLVNPETRTSSSQR